MDNYINILESRVFDYFVEDLENSLKEKEYESLQETLNSYSESDSLNSSLQMNYFVEKILNPEFGITLKDLLSALKENKTTFKNYVISILEKKEFNLQESLQKDGYFFKEGLLSNLFGIDDENGSMSGDTEVDPDEIKKKVIKSSLESENIDLDDLSSEELDALMARTVPVTEKVKVIKDFLKEKDDNLIAKCISHYTGMHLEESLEIIKKDW